MLLRKSLLVIFLGIGLVCGILMHARAKEAQSQPYKTIATAELKELLDSNPKSILVIDVRNPEEYQDVHIAGAVNIPQKKIEQYKYLLPEDKTARLIFYCNGVK